MYRPSPSGMCRGDDRNQGRREATRSECRRQLPNTSTLMNESMYSPDPSSVCRIHDCKAGRRTNTVLPNQSDRILVSSAVDVPRALIRARLCEFPRPLSLPLEPAEVVHHRYLTLANINHCYCGLLTMPLTLGQAVVVLALYVLVDVLVPVAMAFAVH